jgi:hypothetical protein
MNIKQVFTVVVISAATTVTTLFTYSHFTQKPLAIQTENGKSPCQLCWLVRQQ